MLAVLTLFRPSPAQAQQPAVIKLLTGNAAGGGGDLTARALAEALQAKLGTTVIVENKPGAGGVLAAQALKAAPADGSVYLLASDHLYIAPFTMKAAGYEPQRDFAPVAGINTFDLCVGVNVHLVAATTLADYLAAAAKEPKLATYGVPAPGSIPQFIGFVMGKQAGVALSAVPYKGEAPMITDLSGGHLPAAVGPCRGMLELRKTGKVRLLATAQRLATASEVPTFAESGFKAVTPNWLGIFAPAKLPAPQLLVMQNAIRDVMREAHLRERMSANGFTPRYVSGQELGEMAREAAAYWGTQIRESGYRPE